MVKKESPNNIFKKKNAIKQKIADTSNVSSKEGFFATPGWGTGGGTGGTGGTYGGTGGTGSCEGSVFDEK